MHETDHPSVGIVGGGVAGLTAGIFTARHGLSTTVFDAGDSILRRNAHLENFPGFPLGINARQLLELLAEQAERAGCLLVDARVDVVESAEDGFAVQLADGGARNVDVVIVATKNETGPIDDLPGVEIVDRGKLFVAVDDRGRTGAAGVYAAGRLAGEPHQSAVAAGHGAKVGVTVLEDLDVPFYHDWVAPERYFTGRDREVPPGCEEIDDEERLDRERRAVTYLRDRFDEPHAEPPRQHPSVSDSE